MSRTFKSKAAQAAHRENYNYSKAFGHYTDRAWVEYDDCYRFEAVAIITKRERFYIDLPVKYKTAQNQKSKGVTPYRRFLNKRHRKNVKHEIYKYMTGKNEDVLVTSVGPRSPSWTW